MTKLCLYRHKKKSGKCGGSKTNYLTVPLIIYRMFFFLGGGVIGIRLSIYTQQGILLVDRWLCGWQFCCPFYTLQYTYCAAMMTFFTNRLRHIGEVFSVCERYLVSVTGQVPIKFSSIQRSEVSCVDVFI